MEQKPATDLMLRSPKMWGAVSDVRVSLLNMYNEVRLIFMYNNFCICPYKITESSHCCDCWLFLFVQLSCSNFVNIFYIGKDISVLKHVHCS